MECFQKIEQIANALFPCYSQCGDIRNQGDHLVSAQFAPVLSKYIEHAWRVVDPIEASAIWIQPDKSLMNWRFWFQLDSQRLCVHPFEILAVWARKT